MPLKLTRKQARAVLIAAQDLLDIPASASKADVLNTIHTMHVLQIDTIHVINRSPYLVLWSRIGDFELDWLTDLLAERKLFEYWSHEASFLPIEHFGYYRRIALDSQKRWMIHSRTWLDENPAVLDEVMTTLRANGVARSSDFERTDGQKGGWWNRKEQKYALECLYNLGELVIVGRDKFQRIYALREHALPDWDEAGIPARDETLETLTEKAVAALGVATPAWATDYFRSIRRETVENIQRLLDRGALKTVAVEGWAEPLVYHPDNEGLIERAAAGELVPTRTHLLSPFDPIVWDRARLQALFDFDYRIECYTPAPKRKYGYFSLPILHRDEMVGRFDAKAHRKDGVFEIKALHLEPGVAPDDDLRDDLARELKRFAAWHGTPKIKLTFANDKQFGKALVKAMK
ncbi:MAG: YcaQ family DNA glycosylase [Anaerolineae bacterium]|nr:YcaQ family DNA glycosylase [Anaerolineae bacterium]